MKTLFVDKKNKNFLKLLKKYDGSQLRALFAYEYFGLKGNSVLAWIAPCDVRLDHMVDYEDKIEQSKICGDLMVHFVIEIFPANLSFGVALQRLLAAQVKDIVFNFAKAEKFLLERKGDDVYVTVDKIKKGKLSISIASVSNVSTLIHFAANVTNAGTPVATACLNDLKINPQIFAKEVCKKIADEFESVIFATQKVKPL